MRMSLQHARSTEPAQFSVSSVQVSTPPPLENYTVGSDSFLYMTILLLPGEEWLDASQLFTRTLLVLRTGREASPLSCARNDS